MYAQAKRVRTSAEVAVDDAARVQECHVGGNLDRGGQQRGDVGPLGPAGWRHQECAALDGLLQNLSAVSASEHQMSVCDCCVSLLTVRALQKCRLADQRCSFGEQPAAHWHLK